MEATACLGRLGLKWEALELMAVLFVSTSDFPKTCELWWIVVSLVFWFDYCQET